MTATHFERKTLKEIASSARFAIVDGPFGTQLHAAEYMIEGIPVIRVVNTSFEGRFLTDKLVFISERKARQLERSMVRPGDIIVAKTGATIGKSGIFPSDWQVGIIASSCIKITVDLSKADNRFVGYMIQSSEGQRKIVDGAGGSTRTTINTKPFGAIEFNFPPKLEQTKIAEILSVVDWAIEQTEALIAKQQRIKTGLMQEFLTLGIDEHGDLRSEMIHEFKDSSVGRVPKEWKVQSLGAALHEARGFLQTGPFGSQLHAHEYVHEGIPVIMPQDILLGRVSTAMIARITEKRANDLRRHRIQSNDIVFSRRGDLSRAAAIGERETGWLCGTGCFLLRVPVKDMEARWLADIYRHHHVQRQVETNAVGSTMPSLNNAVMEQLTIAFPSVDEQREITRHRESMDATIHAMDGNLRKLVSMKTALMQDLLNGRRRVTALVARLEEAGA